MNRTLTLLWLLLLTLTIGLEPALANKFETIGGGVSGLSHEKLMLLQRIVTYAGGFLLFLGVLALLTRKRFEGLAGVSGRRSNTAIQGGIALLVIGSLLIGAGYL